MSDALVRRRTAADWARVIDEFLRSGESAAAFAERIGVTRQALSYWRHRVPALPPTVLPVHVTSAPAPPPTVTPAPFELALHDGRLVVRVPPTFERDALVRLLGALREVPPC